MSDRTIGDREELKKILEALLKTGKLEDADALYKEKGKENWHEDFYLEFKYEVLKKNSKDFEQKKKYLERYNAQKEKLKLSINQIPSEIKVIGLEQIKKDLKK